MTVKEHYDTHLAGFYGWMLGDLNEKVPAQIEIFKQFGLDNPEFKSALDLGAGNGLQSLALARMGLEVQAVDFNKQLLDELGQLAAGLPITLFEEDIRNIQKFNSYHPDIILCCGDTLTHLESEGEVSRLLAEGAAMLHPGGIFFLTFRNYLTELQDTARCIPVRSDENRILTCFLEYFAGSVRVTDILYEKQGAGWQMKASSYDKLRLNPQFVADILLQSGCPVIHQGTERGLVTIVARKND